MRKSFIAVAALFAAVAFTACSGSSEKNAEAVDTVAVVEETIEVVDTCCGADTCASDSCTADSCATKA